MSLIYRSPMSLFLDRMFDEDLMLFPSYTNSHLLLSETDDKSGYLLEIPIPGMTKENVKLQLDNNLMYISAESGKKSKTSQMATKYQYVQKIPNDVDIDSIEGSVENGVLTIEMKRSKNIKKIKDIHIR